MKSWVLFLIVLVPILACGGLYFLAAKSARTAPEVGLRAGRLLPLPARPNAVSSEPATREEARVEPLAMLPEGVEATQEALEELLRGLSRVELEEVSPGYLHAVYRSRLFGFHDDLELRLDAEEGLVHVRSAARVGHSDLGANRARVEDLRERWSRRSGSR